MSSLHVALGRLFDYAGLFPPAGLSLDAALAKYAVFRNGPHGWLLGRFVLAAAHVDATADATTDGDGWPLSVVVKDVDAAAAALDAVARLHAAHGSRFRVEAMELAATTPDEIARAAATMPASLERFIEVPFEPDPAPLIEALAKAGCCAKIRTGGVVATAFPSPAQVARFIERCRAAGVAFKATAGLHHAVRASYPMTYEPDAACVTMHGFVNLMMAATLRSAMRVDAAGAAAVLDDTSPESFRFGGRAAAWRREMVTTTEIDFARKTLLRSIGTCSVDEAAEFEQ